MVRLVRSRDQGGFIGRSRSAIGWLPCRIEHVLVSHAVSHTVRSFGLDRFFAWASSRYRWNNFVEKHAPRGICSIATQTLCTRSFSYLSLTCLTFRFSSVHRGPSPGRPRLSGVPTPSAFSEM